MPTIAVYGSSQIRPADPEYVQAQEMGRLLAQHGYAVMTGGYYGIMEAASRGAAEAGGHVIGVTTAMIESLSGAKANQWVTEEVSYPLFSDRLAHLVRHADGYIAMPGGIGTLHEIVNVWELMRLGELPHKPLVCFGQIWREVLGDMMNNRFVHLDYQRFIHFSDEAQAVIDYLKAFNPEQSG